MHPGPRQFAPVSRRHLLSLAGAAALAAATPWRRSAAQTTPAASPTAAAPGAGTPAAGATAAWPMPVALDAGASPEFRAVVEALVAAMETRQAPGAAIGLLAGDREEHATIGVASLSSLRPVTPDTLFQIGSLTKTYTATAIWRLIDEGALSLDKPVRTWIPDLALMDEAVAAKVTIANLLDHSAGWYGDEGVETGDDDEGIARYVADRLPHLPQIFPLGEFFSYNNAGFTLLGRLVEDATGTTYNAAMRNLLLEPLGLNDTLLDHAAVLRRPYADGHVSLPINGRPTVAVETPLWVPRSVDPAGGIWATTRDVLRYARFHLAAGTVAGPADIVSPDSLRQMREPAMPIPGLPSLRMGRDWFVQDVGGIRTFSHSGDTLGQHTDFYGIPTQNFALIVLTNGQSGGSAAATAALDAALAQFPALTPLVGKLGLAHALLAPTGAPTVTLSADALAAYAGRYADPGLATTVARSGDGLTLAVKLLDQPGSWQPAIQPAPAPAAPVTFLANDMAVANGARVPFVRDVSGRVQWVSFGLRLVPRAGAGS
jgi:CubicO group peptidase (beta-lactamase class C family)